MHIQFVRNERTFIARRCSPVSLLLLGLLALAPPSRAQGNLGPITVGAGLQTSYAAYRYRWRQISTTSSSSTMPVCTLVDRSIGGIKFMFNTDYDSVTNKIGVLDAVAQIRHVSQVQSSGPAVSCRRATARISMGRSTRMNGPYTTTAFRTDTTLYPQGRDNGVAYWGDFQQSESFGGRVRRQVRRTGKSDIIGAARVQVDFWDKEDGYYLNGTYYGDKNLLAIGGASQIQDGHTASTIDFLLEKKVLNGGAFSIESEYSNYNRLGGYIGGYEEPGRLWAGKLPVSESGSHRQIQGQVRDPRQICQGRLYAWAHPRATTRKPRK